MEKLDDDYKLFKEDGEPDTNNKNLGFAVNSKNVLQACSNSENAMPLIQESPVLDSTIDEVTKLYDKPDAIASNDDVKKLFNYDNIIFSNLCRDKKAFGDIFKKIGLDKLLDIGKKIVCQDSHNTTQNTSTMQAAMTGNSDNSISVLSSKKMRASCFIWERMTQGKFISTGCITWAAHRG
jgi:hypothetical protein